MHFYSSRRGHLENQCPQAGNNSKAFKSMDANKNEKLSQFKYFNTDFDKVNCKTIPKDNTASIGAYDAINLNKANTFIAGTFAENHGQENHVVHSFSS